MQWWIRRAQIACGDRWVYGSVVIDDGRIIGITSGDAVGNNVNVIDADGGCVLPGLIDCHIHGANGSDFMDGTQEAILSLARYCASVGTTGFAGTTVTASPDRLRTALETAASYERPHDAAQLLGVHVEGPFINPVKKGAQYEPAIRLPDAAELTDLYNILGDNLRILTLAPEMPGSEAVIDFCRAHGITAAVGHSDADFDQAVAAFQRGISHVTHTFNGMRGLHHREPGVLGAVLASEGLFTELVADGVHVHPGAMRILSRLNRSRIVLVTDSVQAAGLPDGRYSLGDMEIFVTEGRANLADGTIAGSTLTMLQAVKNMVELVGVSLLEAVRMASSNPAETLGLPTKGRIAPGYDADLLVTDSALRLTHTIVAGQVVYISPNATQKGDA